jgi:hypothetical protein
MQPKKEIWLLLYFDRQSDSQISFAGGIAIKYALTPSKNMYTFTFFAILAIAVNNYPVSCRLATATPSKKGN